MGVGWYTADRHSIPTAGKDVLKSFPESQGRHIIVQVWLAQNFCNFSEVQISGLFKF